ncbi:interleukin-1 receptor accessory protein-like 1-B isoform X2 [Palaemon carinicauda]|uniref:interleukin-1 receptor accessory protein-like 1-B isoform X2 n=1 Tax=Palaemon carinicauda TaxID=392227 RepID=UPI0035B68DB1
MLTNVLNSSVSRPTKDKPGCGTISEETYAPLGHSITLVCKACIGTPRCANPFKYTLTWSKESRESGTFEQLTSSEEIHITEENVTENSHLSGKLIIKKVQSSHYGTYLCNITNEIGSLIQRVNVTDKVPLRILKEHQLWIACALIICITFIPFWIYGLQHSRANIKFFLRSLRANPSITGDYDVLVVHGRTSFVWVWKVLQPKLEDYYHYKCFFKERDMKGGEDTYCCIAKVVEQCKCVMIIVTPCIVDDSDCLYDIMQAANALDKHMSPIKIFTVILEPIRDQKGSRNQKKVMTILKQLKSDSIKVPESCQKRHLIRDFDDVTSSICDNSKSMTLTSEMKPLDHRLLRPHESCCTLRSRSKSPKDQKLKNMIIGAKGSDISTLSESDNLSKGDTSGRDMMIMGIKRKEEERKERLSKTKYRFPLNLTFKSDANVDEESPPETPCSNTPFMTYSSQEEYDNRNCVSKWMRVFLKGDDEQLFWKNLRLQLPIKAVQYKLKDAGTSRENSV